MRIAIPGPQIRQAVTPCDAPWQETALDTSAERERRRLADSKTDEAGETDETREWGLARTPEAEALLLSRAVALGFDWLLYER